MYRMLQLINFYDRSCDQLEIKYSSIIYMYHVVLE